MFSLDHDLIKLVNVNPRTEKHGDEDVLACDLKIEYRTSNDVLSEFSPTLKNSLFWKDESIQGELIDDVGHLPNLRHPKMSSFKWADEFEQIQFRVHHGVRDQDDIVFYGAKVNNFVFDPQEGGTVAVMFRVQALPTELDAAKLLTLMNKEVHVSMISETGEQTDEFKEAA